ncbi:MAG: hypothetical protein KDC48_13195 [Planctomycetes bacterium]|nr:hypothetical protein [Planctomycetota bacterium]
MSSATSVRTRPAEQTGPPLRRSAGWCERAATATCVAVVVHYRDADQTLACVRSLHQHAPGVPVLVVDNDARVAPQPALLEPIEGDGARGAAALLVTGHNRGFGAGCNAGFDAVLAECPRAAHVLLLNPDARATEGMVQHLCATAAAHPDAGIVGGTVRDADGGAVQFANGRYRPLTLSRLHCAAPAGDTPFATTFVTGALMLLAADLLRAGLRFDERFFLYVEDLDLCCEVRARGRSLWIDPRAVAHHRGGGCWQSELPVLGALTAGQVYWLARSKAVFAAKRLSSAQRVVQGLLAAVVKPTLGVLLQRSVRFLGPYYQGLRDGRRDAARLAE